VAYVQLPVGTYDKVQFSVFNKDAHVILRKADGYLQERKLVVKDEDSEEENDEDDEFKTVTFIYEYTVAEEGVTEITADFNLMNSLEQNGRGSFHFRPDVTILNVQITPGASRLITAEYGGTVEILDDVSIDIPPGALSVDTVISIIPTDSAIESTIGVSRGFSLDNYVFLPENVPLVADATVTMHYDPTILTTIDEVSGNDFLREEMIDIQYFDPEIGHYVSPGRELDKTSKTVTAKTQHFSGWGAFLDFTNLLFWADRALSYATWEIRANDILSMGGDWNTTNVAEDDAYITMVDLYDPEQIGKSGKEKYKGWVIDRWDDYANHYYPPNSTEVGTPMDPFLFVISLTEEVPGYASVPVVAQLYVDVTYGAYIFFHAAQRHDRCSSKGYGTYYKDYSICNQDFYADMDKLCAKFYEADKPAMFWHRCNQTRESFKEAVDLHLNVRVTEHGSQILTSGSGCDDYDGMYARPVSSERYSNCIDTNNNGVVDTLDIDTVVETFGIVIPPSIIPGFPRKECGDTGGYDIFDPPRIKVRWSYPESFPENAKVNIYRVSGVQEGDWAGLALKSLWQVLDTIMFGSFFYIFADIAASHVSNYPATSWRDEINGDTGTYRYYFKTVNNFVTEWGDVLPIYSKDQEIYNAETGENVVYPVEEVYVNKELVNVCLADTSDYYWPHSRNKIKATAEEY
jgi:hypothetical protein